mgnify:CR=1 FL=1
MRYRRFAPLDRDLSCLVLGSMVFSLDAIDLTFAMLDTWLELGGNVVDTAHLYAGGNSERAIGRYLAARGCRDALVLLTKGAHHNVDRRRVTPEDITCDLRDSLARLRTDAVDLYLLHRDDPAVPVGPIVTCLNEHHRAGRIRAFGGSNWTTARLEAANAYAAAHGLVGFTASSPHLSLAVPNGEIWEGTVSAREPADLAWYERTRMPLFAWSSQARGFFAGVESDVVRRVYHNEANFERRRRAEAWGKRHGYSATQVALAWLLHLPLEVYPIVGPVTVEELRACVAALEIALTPEEVRWLDLGDG